eukprot:SAG11_NODE_165_length_13834_cov_72.998544_7_plen_61_part_00
MYPGMHSVSPSAHAYTYMVPGYRYCCIRIPTLIFFKLIMVNYIALHHDGSHSAADRDPML